MPENGQDLEARRPENSRLLALMDRLKRVLVAAITAMMALVLFLAVLELGFILAKDISSPPFLFLEVEELLELFGLFLLVLIGIELFETMEIYIKDNVVHVEVVFTVALIAIARKVIILDIKKVGGTSLLGLGAVVFALSVGYYLILKAKSARK
jgi:uncharacterized membrane protein (DUF373 family)